MRLYIVVNSAWNTIESVWQHETSAKMAIDIHAKEANVNSRYYTIIVRELDSLKTPVGE